MQNDIKILFVGADEKLQKIYGPGSSIEVVSSISFASLLGDEYKPDLIFVNSIQDNLVKDVRLEQRFSFVPIIWVAENFSELNNFTPVSDFQRVLVCNKVIVENEKFVKSLRQLALKKRTLLSPKTSRFVKYAILFVNKNISKSLNRQIISSQLGVSQDYLTRIFHKEMGVSLWDYIEIMRLHYSQKLLMESSMSVSEVALHSGFNDCTYYNREFKKAFGVTPGEFRKGQPVLNDKIL